MSSSGLGRDAFVTIALGLGFADITLLFAFKGNLRSTSRYKIYIAKRLSQVATPFGVIS
jgi:hypothetical protein